MHQKLKLNGVHKHQKIEKKWIDWVFKNLNSIATNKNIKSDELKSFAQKLFEEINLCGYRTGYDSARCDYEEEEF